MKNTLKNALAVLSSALATVAIADDVYVGNGASNNTYTDTAAYASATKIIKTGTGITTLDLGDMTGSFSGEIEVQEGELKVASTPNSFGAPTKITVSSGATLNLSWSGTDTGKIPDAEIFIEGHGKDNNTYGALRREARLSDIDGLIGKLVLTGDSRIVTGSRTGFKTIGTTNKGYVRLNGHKLVKTSGAPLVCNNTVFYGADGTTDNPGDILIAGGTLLVQNGTLKSGDVIVAGSAVGRVRVMTDDRGRSVKKAGPSVPVEITGLADVPQAGDGFDAVSDERLARELVEQRKQQAKEEQFKQFEKVTLDTLFDSLQAGELKELNIIVKADVQGSAEAVKQNLEKLSNDEVRVRIIHTGVGAVNESDVMLANASNAIIVGFNVRPDPVAALNAEKEGVEMRMYRVIYDCIEEIQAAIKGMLAPKFREVELGRAEIRQVVHISSVGNIAGCYVQSGKITRNSKIRLVRDGIVITEDEISSLRRFKDDVKEVKEGYECGIGLNKYNDIKEGDIFEAFIIEEYRD